MAVRKLKNKYIMKINNNKSKANLFNKYKISKEKLKNYNVKIISWREKFTYAINIVVIEGTKDNE